MILATLALGVLTVPAPLVPQDCSPGWWQGMGMPAMQGTGWPHVLAIEVADFGAGPEIWVAGNEVGITPSMPKTIMRRTSAGWFQVPGSSGGASIVALASGDLGGGMRMFVAGSFTQIAGVPANRVAAWNGTGWEPLGAGVDSFVSALLAHDDGTGLALYAGGNFTEAGGMPANRVARWDGLAWSPLGTGPTHSVRALCFHDDGSGPSLFAGTYGGPGVWRFDGALWHPLPVPPYGVTTATTRQLLVHPIGGVPRLVATGTHLSGGIYAWDGANWSGFPAGPSGQVPPNSVPAMASVDDGTGPRLWAAREPVTWGQAPYLLSWKDGDWTSHATDDWPTAFRVTGEPGAQTLYAGGYFKVIDAAPSPVLAVRHPCGVSAHIRSIRPCVPTPVELGAHAPAAKLGKGLDLGLLSSEPMVASWVFVSGGLLPGVGAGGCGVPFGSGEVLIDPAPFLVLLPEIGFLPLVFYSWKGSLTTFVLPIPAAPQFAGLELAMQALSFDATAAAYTSTALAFTIQP